MPLKKLGTGQGLLKAGFQGFQGSGKTFSACLLAAATRKHFGLKGPIALVDSENATEYVAPLIKQLTGEDLVGERTRDFTQLVPLANECVQQGISVMIVDSVTHYWRNLCDSYLAGVNQQRRSKGQSPRTRLEFADWNPIKGQWGSWTDAYLNLPLHVIIAGRAGFEYDMSTNEETGRKELEKVGIKMKTESEFGYEPSLLVMMELDQKKISEERFEQIRTAMVLKDRFGAIDGSSFVFRKLANRQEEMQAVMDAFMPHLAMLRPGAHSTVQTSVEPMHVSEEGDVEWVRERKARTILSEEIQGLLVSKHPGQTAEEKKIKADLIQKFFGTRSWSKVEGMRSEDLKKGLELLRLELGESVSQPETEEDDLPYSAPQAVQAQPEAQNASQAPSSPATGVVVAIRTLMAPQKIVESRFLGMLGELGTIPRGLQTLEEVQLTATEGTLDLILNEWGPFTKAYKDAIK